MKANYNKSEIMRRAWKLFKNQEVKTMEMFAECLRQSWNIAKNGTANNNIADIYNKYYKGIYYFVLSKVGGKSEIAEEITNDVFLKCDEHLYNYDVHKAKINTWLYFIANNMVIDYYRKNKNNCTTNIGEFVDEEGKETFQIADSSYQEENVENKELSEQINSAMSKLKPKYRKVAEQYFMQGKKYEEIAEILDMPMGTVKAMIYRVREKLQNELKSVRGAK